MGIPQNLWTVDTSVNILSAVNVRWQMIVLDINYIELNVNVYIKAR